MNKYLNLDCMEGMKHYPDKYFELAIVDPPYGIGDYNQSECEMRVDWNDSIPELNYFNELNRISRNQIIWGANYYNCFNGGGAIVWYKGKMHPSMSDVEIASCSLQKRTTYIHITWQSGFYRTMKEGKVIHPCQKPVKLYEWLLTNYAKQGDKILDTHVGSGSSIIAFEKHGFEYVGFEIDKDYYKDSLKRIEKHRELLKQEKIF